MGVFELMANIINRLAELFFPMQYGAWGLIAYAVCTILMMVGFIGLNKRLRQGVGKFGGLSISLLLAALGVGLTIGLVKLSGLGADMIAEGLGQIPHIGAYLAKISHWIIGAFASIVILIVMGVSILKGAGALQMRISLLRNRVRDNLRRPNQKGHNTSHVLAGAFGFAAVLCHPIVNQALYFFPGMLGCLLGLYTLVFVRPKWSDIKQELHKGHAVEFGTLPYEREIENEDDREMMEEALEELDRKILLDIYAKKLDKKRKLEAEERRQLLEEGMEEAEATLNGGDLAERIKKQYAKRQRIAEDIEVYDSEHATDEERAKLAELEAQVEADAEAEAEEEADEPRARRHT